MNQISKYDLLLEGNVDCLTYSTQKVNLQKLYVTILENVLLIDAFIF